MFAQLFPLKPPHHRALLSCATGRKPHLAQLQNEASPSLNFTVIKPKYETPGTFKCSPSPEAFLLMQDKQFLLAFTGKSKPRACTHWGGAVPTSSTPFHTQQAPPARRKGLRTQLAKISLSLICISSCLSSWQSLGLVLQHQEGAAQGLSPSPQGGQLSLGSGWVCLGSVWVCLGSVCIRKEPPRAGGAGHSKAPHAQQAARAEHCPCAQNTLSTADPQTNPASGVCCFPRLLQELGLRKQGQSSCPGPGGDAGVPELELGTGLRAAQPAPNLSEPP